MTRPRARFTQADIARAIRAVEQTGAKMEIRIELDGTIRIVPHEPEDNRHRPTKYTGQIRL